MKKIGNPGPRASISLAEALNLQAIENNPLDAEQIAMFEMFEREGWDHARRIAYIRKKYTAGDATHAAE